MSSDIESGIVSGKQSIEDMALRFASFTSAHGIPILTRINGSTRRWLWVCVCFVAFGTLVFQVVLLTRRYFQTPKYTMTELQSEPIPFPLVSLCNLQSIDMSQLEITYNELVTKYRLFRSDTTVFDTIYTFEKAWQNNDSAAGVPSRDSLAGILAERYALNLALMNYIKSSNLSFSYRHYIRTLHALPETLLGRFGSNLLAEFSTKKEQFIVACYFQFGECTHENFEMFFTPYFYNCFTFNPATVSGDNDTRTLFTGAYGGLSVQLFTPNVDILNHLPRHIRQQFEGMYNPIMSSGGIRVLVHAADEWPNIGNSGIEIPSGFSGSLKLHVHKLKRLKSDGKCIFKDEYIHEHNISQYSEVRCKSFCIQTYIRSVCNCTHPSFVFDHLKTYPICAAMPELPLRCYHPSVIRNISNDEQCVGILDRFVKNLICQKNVVADQHLKTRLGACNCRPPCDEYKYDARASLSQWPTSLEKASVLSNIVTNGFLDHFTNELKEKYFSRILFTDLYSENLAQSGNQSEFISEGHFIRLNVYLADTTVLTTTEHPSYDGMQVISDIGGQMGLWMGLSIITIAEISWLLLAICKKVISTSMPSKLQNTT